MADRPPIRLEPIGDGTAIEEPKSYSPSRRLSPVMMDAACYFYAFSSGWNDSCTGPLLPFIQSWYHINYVTVSSIFICYCVGIIASSIVLPWLQRRITMGKALFMGSILQLSGSAILPPTPPFPVFAMAYVLIGFGAGIQFSQANVYMANRPGASQKLGFLHGSYGLGGVVSPLVATAFTKHRRFSLFYLIVLGLLLVNTINFLSAFKLRNPPANEVSPSTEDPNPLPTTGSAESKVNLLDILKQKLMWIMMPFFFIYVGSEVTIGGWTVSFFMTEKHGGSNSGYIVSGYWAGLALGRICLPFLNIRVGERRVIFVYIVFAICMEIIVWFVPSLVGDAIALAIVGVLMGPFFPIGLSIATKLLPKVMHTGAVGLMASVGQSGSAVFPFITGALAQRFGVKVLQPILLAMFGAMGFLWCFMPKVAKRND